MIRKLFLTICALLIAFYGAKAQSSWQWGKRGGSSTASLSGGHDEEVKDMATDPNGNIYVLSDVWAPGLDIDGHAKGGYGSRDMLLSSFKCDGTYRWSKIIGGNQPDLSTAVKTDTLGGVYITGQLAVSASSLYIDTDSSWVGGSHKSLFIAKFDTAGTYKWSRMPQADTVTNSSDVGAYDMDVDGAGNIYLFCCLTPAAYAGGAYVVTTNKVHVLKYNRDGFFQSGVPMPITFSGPASPRFQFKRDHGNGRFYVTGNWGAATGGATFGTTPLTYSIFIGAFNSAGSLLWVRQNSNSYGAGFERADVDKQHNIYVAGTSGCFGVNDTFNGYTVVSTGAYQVVPLVVKIDTNGNNIWAKNGAVNAATPGRGIVVNGAEVAVTGSYPGKLKWVGYTDSFNHPMGCGYSPFITRFNATTGDVLKLDSLLSSCGYQSEVNSITADKSGNFYIGGYFTGGITVSGTLLSSAGGGSDFFVAKYGTTNCGCTLPAAGFTATGTRTVTYTYTGTAGYDSVRWNFGDGATSTLASPTHYYSAVGTYTVCVTVYNSCGSNVYCQTVTISNVGVSTLLGSLDNVAIYPNPMSEQLILENVQTGTAIRLYNMMGQQVYSSVADDKRQMISTQKLPPGSYVLQLIDNAGNTMSKTMIKQ